MQIPRQQGFHVFHRLGGGQVTHDAAQPGVGFLSIGFGRLQQRVNNGAGVGTGRRVAKQPGFATDQSLKAIPIGAAEYKSAWPARRYLLRMA